jgi:hypothetical protein
MTSLQVKDKIHFEPSKYGAYFLFDSNWISSNIHLLFCLPSPTLHYNGKFIMQVTYKWELTHSTPASPFWNFGSDVC